MMIFEFLVCASYIVSLIFMHQLHAYNSYCISTSQRLDPTFLIDTYRIGFFFFKLLMQVQCFH